MNEFMLVVRNHRPAPQGSKRHVGQGRLIEQSKRVAPWRAAVKAAAQSEYAGRESLDGPLRADIVFTVQKPKSAPKTRRTWPVTRSSGDLDKLLRSTFDALSDAGVIKDDSCIVYVCAGKRFPGDPGTLDEPGATIRISRYVDH